MNVALRRLLRPDAIAVVGASQDPTKRGNAAIASLQDSGYSGKIYPVNPNADGPIRGLAVHHSIASIPGSVDLAFVATPAVTVPDVLEDCGDAGVAGAVVIAAGFGEAGNEDLANRLITAAETHGIRVVGPNVNGLASPRVNVNFLGIDVPAGRIALLLQSGNVAVDLLNQAVDRGSPGFSYYVPIGNEADLTVQEYLRFFDDDPWTDGVAIFAEGFGDGRAVLETARDVTPTTPVAMVKGGLSRAARHNAVSHTASLVGDADTVATCLRAQGVAIVDRLDELLPVVEALVELPPPAGDAVGVLTDGGGDATLAADALDRDGLTVPPLASETRSAIEARIPEAPTTRNPVDVLTAEHDLDRLADGTEMLLADPEIESVLLTGIIGGHGIRFSDEQATAEVDVAQRLGTLVRDTGRPVVVQSKYADTGSASVDALRAAGIPVYRSIDTAVRCLTELASYGRNQRNHANRAGLTLPNPNPHPEIVGAHTGRLGERAARSLVADYGADVAPSKLATSPAEAVEAAATFTGPVAMKVVAPEIAHKTEAGGVALEVSAESVATEYEAIVDAVAIARPDAAIEGVLVSPMVEGNIELLIGGTTDPEIGPVLTLGLGGIFTEEFADVCSRPLPVTASDAQEMLDGLDARAILRGARGRQPVDESAIVDLLVAISTLVSENPRIVDLDLNPVIATSSRAVVVDADVDIR